MDNNYDDHTAYALLNMIGKHMVTHGRKEYRIENIHINGLEGL